MPARGRLQDGAPTMVEVVTRDLDRTVTFYTELFGWDHESYGADLGHYGRFLHDGEEVAGVGPLLDEATQEPGWVVYLHADDVAAAAARVEANGGRLDFAPDDVPGQGRFALATDPSGARLGLWQPAGNDGFARVMEPGAPCWFEVWTTGFDAATAFYRDVVGWKIELVPSDGSMRYATNDTEEAATAGIYDAAGEARTEKSSWLVYLGVADVDTAAAKVTELGGTVLGEPADSPFGRLVDIRDPAGALLRLITA